MTSEKRKTLNKLARLTAITSVAKWHSPIINTVVIPAHAQTSECTENQILGLWSFRELDLFRTIRIEQDGLAFFIELEVSGRWQLSENTLSLDLRPSSFVFSGEFVGGDCSNLIGMNGPFEVVGRKLE